MPPIANRNTICLSIEQAELCYVAVGRNRRAQNFSSLDPVHLLSRVFLPLISVFTSYLPQMNHELIL
jgi:hypothetical protein